MQAFFYFYKNRAVFYTPLNFYPEHSATQAGPPLGAM
jgi:hypothetical protein